MAEFERELIRERVKAGMKNAKAKGARIGRPRMTVDAFQIGWLRDSGVSLREIAARLGVSLGTVAACSKKEVVSERAPSCGGDQSAVESSHLANFTIVLRVSVEFIVTTAGPPLNMCQAAYCSL